MTEKKLDPRVSEFETEEQAASYDRWFRAKVQASLDDPSPVSYTHLDVYKRQALTRRTTRWLSKSLATTTPKCWAVVS